MLAYKDKKTRKWFVSFYIRDPLTNKSKKVCKCDFTTKKEALQYENDYKIKIDNSIQMIFGDFLNLFLEDMKHKLSPVIYTITKGKIEKWIRPNFENMSVSEITPLDIRKWHKMVVDEIKSPTYHKKLRSILVAIFNYAVKYYDLKDNPCNKIDTIGSYRRSEITFRTLEEFNLFISFVDNPKLQLAYETLFYTGLRIGELVALRPIDFDLDKGTLSVNRNLQIVDGEELFFEPKTPQKAEEQ